MSGRGIEEILTEALGPPVEQNSLILAIRRGAAVGPVFSPKQARALLAKSRKKPTKKLPPEVTLENLGLSIDALRFQLQGMDDDTMAAIESASKIRIALEGISGIEVPDPQPTHRVSRSEMIRGLDALARAVVAVRGWLEHLVKVSGYHGGADPNYQERYLALFVAEEFLARTGRMPSMPNYDVGPQGSPYSRLLVRLFERFGFNEGSIWNAGKWAVDEMAKKD